MTMDVCFPHKSAVHPLRVETGLPQQLVDRYCAELPDKIEALAIAVLVHDHGLARTLSHRLRGSAAMYGFPAVSELAGCMEDVCRTDPFSPTLTDLVDDMMALAGATVDDLATCS